MINITITDEQNFSIYDCDEKLMNEYNRITKSKIKELKNKITKGFFDVPFIYYDQAWGTEKVFLPFTNKLFKVIETNKGDTSVQLHPLKSEEYVALNDNTIIYDGNNSEKIDKYNSVLIRNNTIHSLYKDSKVFEEQDNNIFDSNETIRIYDKLGRKINEPIDYYKYLLPHIQNKIEHSSRDNNLYNDKDRFIFIIDGYILIEYNGVEYKLDKEDQLYFLDKNVLIKGVFGNTKISKINYYNMVKHHD